MTIRLTVLVLLMGALLRVRAEGPMIDEYQVKAAFLFNFAKFVEWSPPAFNSPTQPIGICVLGHNPFGAALLEAVRGKVVANRTFLVREISDSKQAGGCHILFFSASERKRLRAVMAELRGNSVLAVGETEDFIANGGMIAFKMKDARVRFDIDVGTAERANLRISSKLLSLAETLKR